MAIALALVMICGGIAIYAAGDANEKRIGEEDTAKLPPEASIETEAKVTPEPEAVVSEESDEQVWKLQLADTPVYVGVSPNDPYIWELNINGLPGTVDKELIAEFTEMLNGLRMRKVTKEDYQNHVKEIEQSPKYNSTSHESFHLYSAEGRLIGWVFFSRRAFYASNAEQYPEENPGWENWVIFPTEEDADARQWEIFIIDESTFDEELLERMWKECLYGVNPYEFITNLDEVTAGNNPYGKKPIDLYGIDVIKTYREDTNHESDDVIAVPVD